MRAIWAMLLLVASPVAAEPREWVDDNKAALLREYLELLAIPNVATDLADIRRNADHIVTMMERRGLSPRLLESADRSAPPLIYGEWLVPGADRTYILYAHYDGQPATPDDWLVTRPFEPVLLSNAAAAGGLPVPLPVGSTDVLADWRVYARSASDDKAGVMAILAAVDALRAEGRTPSFNLKIVFEGEEEAGSPHFAELLRQHRSLLASDGWIIIDGPAHQAGPIQLSLGVRGIVTGSLTVYGPIRPLHSGHYGNWAPNPAMMLAELLASMKDDQGRVTIEGFYDDVEPFSSEERAITAAAPMVDTSLMAELGLGSVEGGGAPLADLIQLPSLNIGGLQSADVGAHARNAVPSSATASFDMRLVRGNDPQRQFERLGNHIRRQGYEILEREPTMEERRRHPRIARLDYGVGYPAERLGLDHPLAQSVRRALDRHGPLVVLPTLGGSLPLYLLRQELDSPNVIVSLWNHDNNQHAENENIRLEHLWNGIAAVAGILVME